MHIFQDHGLAIQLSKCTEAAAIASSALIGSGDQYLADQKAVEALRKSLNKLPVTGTIVIGEGERDCAPMLYIGEKVGTKLGPNIDIAVDPLEGTKILAEGRDNAISVLSVAEKGTMLHAPDVYMEKIAIGFDFPEPLFDLNLSTQAVLKNVASAKRCEITDLRVTVLQRSRHQELIAKIREAGAKVFLIDDGDVAAIISTTGYYNKSDIYMGIGGAPEGVLAASALKTLGGQMVGRLIFRNESEILKAKKLGITDNYLEYDINKMVSGNTIFAATWVTDGLLKGITRDKEKITTNTMIINSYDSNISILNSTHLIK